MNGKPLHLVVRFSDTMFDVGDVIALHNEVIEQYGAVWFGKLGQTISQTRVDLLNQQVEKHIPTFVYLVKGNRRKSTAYRAPLIFLEEDFPPKVVVRNKQYIEFYIRPGSDIAKREQVMTDWYRTNLKAITLSLIEKWEPVMGVQVDDWWVKLMKTKWGRCNIQARRIWLNLELIKRPPRCLEFIVVHEMVHLLERKHNERFVELMSKFLPQWRQYREELNCAPLAHAEWGY